MKRLLFAAALLCPLPAFAQGGVGQPVQIQDPTTPTQKLKVNSDGSIPVTGSFSASLGSFAPGGAYANLTATGSSARVALPAGLTVVAYNSGTTAVSCVLGNGSVTAVANEDQIAPGGFFAYVVGSNVDLACIDQTGSASNVVVLSGGTGLPAGSGGGGGGGSGGTVTQGSPPWSTIDGGTLPTGVSQPTGGASLLGTTGQIMKDLDTAASQANTPVAGQTASGSAGVAPPVLIGGTQNAAQTGVVQNLKIDSSGEASITAAALPLPTGAMPSSGGSVTANAGTNLNTSALELDTTGATANTNLGAPGATACTTDTASCSLNQLAQRQAQRLTTINTTLGTPMQATGGSVTANAGTNLNTSALATDAHLTQAQSAPGTPQTQAFTIQGNSSGVAVPVTSGVAQGSTTSGQTVSPTGCRTLTSAPTDTTAQTNIPWCRTNGTQAQDLASINGTTVLAGTGAVGTGSPRVAVGTDTATIAGSSPTSPLVAGGIGATGSAPPANAVYQGANIGGNLTGLVSCQNSVIYDASTNGATQLVALSSGKVVYICGYTIFAAGTANVELDYGTGTACATGNNKITPAYQLTAQTGISDQSPYYRGLNAIASNELCIKTSAGVAVQAVVYYSQF